ncbi:hypothetical protein [Dickeya parazeae]|uniref:hypothetical protein n=1 Tax=Dickeya parazeae TaxID=2893572 RepID=UPI001AED066C|nr:hypothetical protein [Dickeya parazeae]MBP2834706.1 hypothetical protein [Dickeya parazeae]
MMGNKMDGDDVGLIAIFFILIVLLFSIWDIDNESSRILSPKELNEILDSTDQHACVRDKLSKYFSCEENCEPLSKSRMEHALSTCKIEEESKKKEEENIKLFEIFIQSIPWVDELHHQTKNRPFWWGCDLFFRRLTRNVAHVCFYGGLRYLLLV